MRDRLAGAGRDDLVEAAELLVSEVVTNALLHAGTPIDVAFSLAEDGLLVEIGDGSPHLPALRSYAPTAGTGRGLMMLEKMVEDWGVVSHPTGKTVWFHLASGDHDESDPSAMGQEPAAKHTARGETVTVRLLNTPLLLHAAWDEHAQALLREYLLASLGLDSGDGPIQVHAEAHDAIAVLAERVPRPEVGLDPDQVMASATEPTASRPLVDVAVPLGSVPHFRTLDQALETAIALSEEGTFLTPPTQPELQSYRRWVCRQVEGQTRGGDPMPWSAEDEAPPETPAPLWDPAPVTESDQAVIAADDTNRIIAVSGSALELLGYDDRRQLVGQRIVTIIPPRFRQAHIAGFTMHLLTGHSPLIGTAVVVPASRRDGREIEVELTVCSRGVPEGRKVFIAELRDAAG